MRTTKNLAEFIESWVFYADNLSILALRAEVPYEEYERIRKVLLTWVDLARLRQVEGCGSTE